MRSIVEFLATTPMTPSNTVMLREHKEVVRACRKTLQILGENKE